jgi:type IV secretory pathway component VirB8
MTQQSRLEAAGSTRQAASEKTKRARNWAIAQAIFSLLGATAAVLGVAGLVAVVSFLAAYLAHDSNKTVSDTANQLRTIANNNI